MKGFQADGSRSLSSSVVAEHLRNILVLVLVMKAGRNGCVKKKKKIKTRKSSYCVTQSEHSNQHAGDTWSFLFKSLNAESY